MFAVTRIQPHESEHAQQRADEVQAVSWHPGRVVDVLSTKETRYRIQHDHEQHDANASTYQRKGAATNQVRGTHPIFSAFYAQVHVHRAQLDSYKQQSLFRALTAPDEYVGGWKVARRSS